MVGQGIQEFREFTLFRLGFFKGTVLVRLVNGLEGTVNGLLYAQLLGLEKGGGIIGIAGNLPAFRIQQVLDIGLLTKSFIKEGDFFTVNSLLALQGDGPLSKVLLCVFFQNIFRFIFQVARFFRKCPSKLGKGRGQFGKPFAGLQSIGFQQGKDYLQFFL